MAGGSYDDTGKLIAGLTIPAPADRLQEDWPGKLMQTAGRICVTLGNTPAVVEFE